MTSASVFTKFWTTRHIASRLHRKGPFIYYIRTEGGSSAMRTPMYCCHSDVIICAYISEIWEFVRT